MELQNFIHNIEELISSNLDSDKSKSNQVIHLIKDYDGFLAALKSLNSMIGMNEFKSNVVSYSSP